MRIGDSPWEVDIRDPMVLVGEAHRRYDAELFNQSPSLRFAYVDVDSTVAGLRWYIFRNLGKTSTP